jgi:hypothetical protein
MIVVGTVTLLLKWLCGLRLEVDAAAVACGGWSPSAHRLAHHSLGLNWPRR